MLAIDKMPHKYYKIMSEKSEQFKKELVELLDKYDARIEYSGTPGDDWFHLVVDGEMIMIELLDLKNE